jgi:predicted ATPase/signal transduction histidine kinase
MVNQNHISQVNFQHQIYGRNGDISKIHEFLSGKGKNALFIKGASGVGKTVLVRHSLESFSGDTITLSQKIDLINHETTTGPLVGSLALFFTNILSQSEKGIEEWKHDLLKHLGVNAKVLTEVIPELQAIVGSVSEPMSLGESEALVRYEIMLLSLFDFISKKDSRKIVLFVDDLQWASARTIGLLEKLIVRSDKSQIAIIGAYRDNTASDSPVLDLVKKNKNILDEISVSPIDIDDIKEIIDDILESPISCNDLSEIIFAKTGGNPFHVKQFILYLELNDLLSFDGKHWQCSIEDLRKLSISKNVLELLLDSFKHLSSEEQEFLRVCSVIGNEVSKEYLKVFFDNKKNNEQISNSLSSNLFLLEDDERIFFAHDKIHEAAYESLDEESRRSCHLKLGHYLLDKKTLEDEEILIVCGHLNDIYEGLSEKDLLKLIHFNYQATHIAKKSGAFGPALEYNQCALELVQKLKNNDELSMDVIVEHAGLLYLNGMYDACESYVSDMLLSNIDENSQVKLINQMIIQKTAQGDYSHAISNGRKALKILGHELPEDNLKDAVLESLKFVESLVADYDMSVLVDAAEMIDERHKLAMTILINMDSPCYLSNIDLYCIVVSKMVELTLNYGPVPESAKAYASYGIVLSSFKKFEEAYKFNKLGIEIAQRFDHMGQLCRACHTMANHVIFWSEHIKKGDDINTKGFEAGHDAGEYLWAGFIKLFKPYNQFFRARRLDELQNDILSGLSYCKEHPNQLGLDTLMGLSVIVNELSSQQSTGDINHEQYVKQCRETNSLMALSMYLSTKVFTLLLEGDYNRAERILQESIELLPYSYAVITNVYDDFVKAFLCIVKEDPRNCDGYEDSVKTFEKLARSAPENFEAMLLIIKGEQLIKEDKFYEAIETLESASNSAHENGYCHIEALANLRLFYHWNKKGVKFAPKYRELASDLFARWGAVKLEKKYKGDTDDLGANDTVIVGKVKELINSKGESSTFLDIAIDLTGATGGRVFNKRESEISTISSKGKSSFDFDKIVNYTIRTNNLIVLSEENQEFVNMFTSTVDGDVMSAPIGSSHTVVLFSKEKFTKRKKDIVDLLVTQFEIILENNGLNEKLVQSSQQIKDQVELQTRQLQQERDKAESISTELRDIQREQVSMAQKAGRTEVVANVLHNIGNHITFVANKVTLLQRGFSENSIHEILDALIKKIQSYPDGVCEFVEKDPVGKDLISFLGEVITIEKDFVANYEDSFLQLDTKLNQIMELMHSHRVSAHNFVVTENYHLEKIAKDAINYVGLVGISTRIISDINEAAKVDVEKVKNILINLYSNAKRACAMNNQPSEIVTKIFMEGEIIAIDVIDNGIGIEEDKLAKIFQSGYSTKEGKGNGFGLHNSSVVAQKLGGSLTCSSLGTNLGATFSLRFTYNQ